MVRILHSPGLDQCNEKHWGAFCGEDEAGGFKGGKM